MGDLKAVEVILVQVFPSMTLRIFGSESGKTVRIY
jgi:hypothetical protein